MRALRFFAVLLGTTLRTSLAQRGAFLLQAAFLLLNNLLFFSTWWILLQRFEHVRGYRMADMLLLFGVSSCGFGLTVLVAGGGLELARTIAEGNLDALLSQPKSVLLRALVSRSVASGWGDLASGTLMLALSGYVGWASLPLALLAVALAATVLVSSAVLLNCLAFWLRDVESVTLNLVHYLLALTLYPPTLFEGGARFLLFTICRRGSSYTSRSRWLGASSRAAHCAQSRVRSPMRCSRTSRSCVDCDATRAGAASASGVEGHPGGRCRSRGTLGTQVGEVVLLKEKSAAFCDEKIEEARP